MSQIENLRIKISAELGKNTDPKQIERLSESLESLKKLDFSNLINSGKNINSLSKSLEKLSTISFSGFSNKINAMIRGLEPLKNLELGNINNFGKGLNSLANGLIKLDKIDVNKFTTQILKLVSAIKPLTDEMLRGGNAANSYATVLSKIGNETDKTKKKSNGLSGTIGRLFSGFTLLRKALRFGAEALNQGAAYIENLNLFEVTMGSANEQVFNFATNMANAYKASSNEVIRFMGLFKQMASAIGVSEEAAIDMSKALTALGYDIASLYNISTEQAMEKLRAGLAGQTKPLRSLGLDITAQSLDKYLKDVAKVNYTSKMLSQNDKFLLRSILMIEQAQAAYGDYAATINSFANQQKVFKNSIIELQTVIGSMLQGVFRPFLVAINAVIIGLTTLFKAIAPLPKETGRGIEDMASNLGTVDEELEKIQNRIQGISFAKFESLTTKDDKQNQDISSTLESLFNNTYLEYMTKVEESLANIKITAEKLAEYLTPVAVALGIMASEKVLKGLGSLKTAIFGVAGATNALNIASGFLRTAGIFLLVYAIYQLVTKWDELDNVMRAVWITVGILGATLIILSNQTILKTTINAIKQLIARNTAAKTSLLGVRNAALSTRLAFLGIGVAVGLLIGEGLKKLPSEARVVIGIFLVLTGVVIALAIAVGALQSAWTIGIAAAAIVAGIIAITSAISEATGKTPEVKEYAKGGIPYKDMASGGNLFSINERGKAELMYENKSGNVEISNQQSLEISQERAFERVMAKYMPNIIRAIQDNSIVIKPVSNDELFNRIEQTGRKQNKSFYKGV